MPHGHKRATIARNVISSYVLQEEMQCKTLYLPFFYEGLKPFRETILTLYAFYFSLPEHIPFYSNP